MNEEKTGAELAEVNRKILAPGESLPAVTLQDGSRVQTGTVAAMLHNIALYDQGARGEVERQLELAVPTLCRIGLFRLFRLFSPDEWMAGATSPGRRFVGERARDYLAAGGEGGIKP